MSKFQFPLIQLKFQNVSPFKEISIFRNGRHLEWWCDAHNLEYGPPLLIAMQLQFKFEFNLTSNEAVLFN